MAKVVLDWDLCKGCLLCTTACEKGLLKRGDEFNCRGYYTVVMEKTDSCTGCALCAEMCPDVAISVWK